MNYDALSLSYRDTQIERVLRSVKTWHGVETGRVVPGAQDLSLGAGRRLQMAILFLDICGFSARRSETPAEQRQNLLALGLFLTEMIRIAEDYGGTVEKNTGDGLMAYFENKGGAPHELGAKRALSSALTMMNTNAAILNLVLRHGQVDPIHFRVGIDYGAVTLARIGAAQRFNSIAAVGTAANIAAKMLDKAGPDEIVIGDAVYHQLPVPWRRWCIPMASPSGWEYIGTGAPYPFFHYTGRWKEPTLP